MQFSKENLTPVLPSLFEELWAKAKKPAFKVVFDKAMELTKDSIELDKQSLGKAGFFEKRRLSKAVKYLKTASLMQPENGVPMLFIAK